jgi:uncharacterized membrane protein
MTRHLIAYAFTLLGLIIIDGIWLRLIMMPLYHQHLRHLLADSVTVWPIVVFYLFYPAGICFFVVNPAIDRGSAMLTIFGSGFFLGLLAYCAYDLTNLATLRAWPTAIAALDILWGGIVTALAAVVGCALTRMIRP